MTADLSAIPDRRWPEFNLPGLGGALPELIDAAQYNQTPVRASLRHLYDQLIDPLRIDDRAHVPSDGVDVTIAQPGSDDARMAAAMIDLGYCSRYYTGDDAPVLPPEPPILRSRSYTLIANAYLGDRTVLLGTSQVIVGPTVPALTLFSAANDEPYDVRAGGANGYPMIGELRRLAINPILEMATDDEALRLALRELRQGVYRSLHAHMLKVMETEGIETTTYTILTPETFRFLSRGGALLRPINGSRLRDTVELRQLQSCFAGYWRPNAPVDRQPALYQVLYPSDDSATA